MSVKIIDYILCQNCACILIGKSEKSKYIYQIGRIAAFKVTVTLLCLRCQKVQAERVEIREILEN